MKFYAVIDTNVIIAALLSKNSDSATIKVVRSILDGTIIPLYHEDIIAEYEEVMKRPKFHLKTETVDFVLNAVRQFGVYINPARTGETLPDMDDLIFYEVAMDRQSDNAYLVTGNLKRYPVRSFIVTPAEMMKIIGLE